ncbi:NnrU family protein [Halomonas sp. MCCC 1A17488]|uniref:NnrU family protein n=1 Tax=Billgrantia sulfidoxydans TaxID=2733484 RepID=A0ABX7W1D8_9GAMM|nr:MULTISPECIES: NnrU family protein [Halomonas]MCE8016197.1 NnrU family protein [Halomonas sp. MCCC 1A17488]MCG3239530.1 NnrU family protein [Halomonas sp. MCCC 1A17488]QPP50549.1 NnrU family protein [Halomonas sp. SS10-MC5]QTP54136.1 NnrU family protein [Halomonas sulfidoxydans]
MLVMILGLVLFLGTHSVRIFADDWRSKQIQRLGEMRWKGLFSLVSIVGLALAIWGFGRMRLDPTWVWFPPVGMRHAVALLMLPAFLLLVAAYVPHNHIKAKLGHPMVLAVKVWAFAHLLANGRLGDIVFFGAFLLWAVLDFRSARRRQPAPAVSPRASGTLITLGVGLVAYYLFAFHLHVWVTGVPVM